MHLNAQKAGFSSKSGLLALLIIGSLSSIYCSWLLYVVWCNLWISTRERVSLEMTKEIELAGQKNGPSELSISVSTTTEKIIKKQMTVDVRIKWIVTLYIFGCFWACFGLVFEHLIYALVESVGKACPLGLYIMYVRAFMQGLLYSFYLMRATVLLQGSVFEIPKWQQYFFGTAPTVSYSTVLFAYSINIQLSHCDETSFISLLLTLLSMFVDIFWNITLFVFLIYHVYKIANETTMINDQIGKDLKEYLKKLLQLFVITEISAIVMFTTLLVPGWSDAFWSAAIIDTCINCSSMLLSFAFAKPIFDSICLCKCKC